MKKVGKEKEKKEKEGKMMEKMKDGMRNGGTKERRMKFK